jgi:hypothetical protein
MGNQFNEIQTYRIEHCTQHEYHPSNTIYEATIQNGNSFLFTKEHNFSESNPNHPEQYSLHLNNPTAVHVKLLSETICTLLISSTVYIINAADSLMSD